MLRVGPNVDEGPCGVKKGANHTDIVGNRILAFVSVLFLDTLQASRSKSRSIVIITGDANRAG